MSLSPVASPTPLLSFHATLSPPSSSYPVTSLIVISHRVGVVWPRALDQLTFGVAEQPLVTKGVINHHAQWKDDGSSGGIRTR